jgi:anti-anti-sigma factor
MRLEQVGLPGGILLVKLVGPLDIAGANEVETPLGSISETHDRVIISFDGVTFLASIGIRVLVKTARAIGKRNGRLVVYGLNADARKVLRSTGVDTIVPVAADQTAAIAECSR